MTQITHNQQRFLKRIGVRSTFSQESCNPEQSFQNENRIQGQNSFSEVMSNELSPLVKNFVDVVEVDFVQSIDGHSVEIATAANGLDDSVGDIADSSRDFDQSFDKLGTDDATVNRYLNQSGRDFVHDFDSEIQEVFRATQNLDQSSQDFVQFIDADCQDVAKAAQDLDQCGKTFVQCFDKRGHEVAKAARALDQWGRDFVQCFDKRGQEVAEFARGLDRRGKEVAKAARALDQWGRDVAQCFDKRGQKVNEAARGLDQPGREIPQSLDESGRIISAHFKVLTILNVLIVFKLLFPTTWDYLFKSEPLVAFFGAVGIAIFARRKSIIIAFSKVFDRFRHMAPGDCDMKSYAL